MISVSNNRPPFPHMPAVICYDTMFWYFCYVQHLANIWGGWSDEPQEGFFSNVNTGVILRKEDGFWPFYPGEPNGELLENCVVVWTAHNAWNDAGCSEEAYSFCHIPTRPNFQLRGEITMFSLAPLTLFAFYWLGLPKNSLFDDRYTFNADNLTNGHYSFDGYTNTRIYYNKMDDVWNMELLSNPLVNASTGPCDYPFGTLVWDLASPSFSGRATMNFNGCDSSHQYNCADGSCIDIKYR